VRSADSEVALLGGRWPC